MIDRSNRLLALGMMCVAFLSTHASAEPPADKPGGPAGPGQGEARGAREKSPGRPEQAAVGDKRDGAPGLADRGEHGGPGKDKDKDRGDNSKGKDKDALDGPSNRAEMAEGRGRFRSGWGSLHDEVRQGKLTKAQLDERLAKLRETSDERRALHREALKRRWGGTLAKPAAREELGHHERRLAFLNRSLLLAETEPKLAKQKEKLVERIEKLIAKENARHEKAMARLEPEAREAPAPQAPANVGEEKGTAK